MTTTWLSPQARDRLEAELADLVSHRDIDTEADDYDDQLIAAWLARKARIREIHELLSTAPATTTFPPDDGVVEPGMVVTVRYDGSDEVETFLLGVRRAEDNGIEVYSPHSPLGQALLGATPGADREYLLPNGARQRVTVVAAAPLGIWLAADAG